MALTRYISHCVEYSVRLIVPAGLFVLTYLTILCASVLESGQAVHACSLCH